MTDHTSRKQNEPLIWTVHDVAQYLRMSETKVYRLVKEPRIPVVRIGKTWCFLAKLHAGGNSAWTEIRSLRILPQSWHTPG